MDKFYRQIKENLEGRQEPPFEVSAWNELERRLDTQGNRQQPLPRWWALALLLLLSLGLNAWFLLSDRQWTNAEPLVIPQFDTLVQKQVVIKTDTIYQTRTIYETVVEYLPAGSKPATFLNTSYLSTRLHQLRPPTYSLAQNTGLNQHNIALSDSEILQNKRESQKGQNFLWSPSSAETSTLENQDWTVIHPLERKPIHLIPRYRDYPLDVNDYPRLPSQKKRSASLLAVFRPKGFQLGLNGGWIFPYNNKVDLSDGNTLGVEGNLLFSDQLHLWIGASLLYLKYEVDKMDEAIGVPFVDPPSDEFVFLNAEVLQKSLQYTIGMQYLLNPKQKWQAFIGAGISAVSILPHEVNYEFENPDLGLDALIPMDVKPGKQLTNYYLLRFGVQRSIFKHMDWQINTSYRANWGQQNIQQPNFFSLQTGLNYRF